MNKTNRETDIKKIKNIISAPLVCILLIFILYYNFPGEAYMKVGQLDEAERWYQKALESKPDHIPAHITTARLLLKKVKKPTKNPTYKHSSCP